MTKSAGKGKKGLATADRILQVARDLFAEKGFEGTSIRQIAKAAGVTVPTLYLYYSDKLALYRAVCREVFDRNFALIVDAWNRAQPAGERLINTVEILARAQLHDPHMAKLLQREIMGGHTDRLHEITASEFMVSFAKVQEMLAEVGGADIPGSAGVTIHALIVGAAQFDTLGPDVRAAMGGVTANPRALAEFVVRIVAPQAWAKVIAERSQGA